MCIRDRRRVHGEDTDDFLMQFLRLAINDKLGKRINFKIAKKAQSLQKLSLDAELHKIHKSYVMVNIESICKACRKKLYGARSMYVYPNGVVVHTGCVKDPKICPVTNINFTRKVFEDNNQDPVSYTHLTLPTILLVQISVVAVSLKQNTTYQSI
eukprot:TRINITY_DN51358_c0_g1_i1.p2 TRINITY_DN51358_c0_g1~~TRINITY_DN51358_c0_g1_i1.p2  ORF type:complete len:155 (-),score=32.64 TRINITY_DN51358_c0_g1_i1:80-544(-)